MNQQYIRDVILQTPAGMFGQQDIGGTAIKIEFEVEKTTSGVPNTATIKLWNLKRSSRDTLKEEFGRITLEAGYLWAGNRGIIFDGFTRDVVHEPNDVDIVTTLQCGDGDKAIRKSHVAKTYPKKTPVKDIILDIQSKMKDVKLGEIILPDNIEPSKRAVTFMTTPQRALNELGRTYGFYWSIQNGALEIIPHDKALSGLTYVTPRTGMIGVPTITDTGVIVQALLNPDIRPNRRVFIQSKTTDEAGRSGTYRVSSAGYAGNNRDGDMLCEFEAELMKGDKVVSESKSSSGSTAKGTAGQAESFEDAEVSAMGGGTSVGAGEV